MLLRLLFISLGRTMTRQSISISSSTASGVVFVILFNSVLLISSFGSKSRCFAAYHRRCPSLCSAPIFAERTTNTDVESYVHEWRDDDTNKSDEEDRFNAHVFASSKCWGRRRFLIRGAFDATKLLHSDDDEENGFVSSWPTWVDVVAEIAADDESESR